MNKSVRWIVRLAVLLALTMAFQFFHFPQFVTGPFVNMMLLLTTLILGIWGGLALGFMTPLIAFLAGISGRADMIPVIMIGNMAYVSVFFWIDRKKDAILFESLGLIVASLLKYLVFAVAIEWIVMLPPQAAQAFGISQFFTAIAGGVLAILVKRVLRYARLLS